MNEIERIAREHAEITRRYFMKLSAAGVGTMSLAPLQAHADQGETLLAQAVSTLEYLTQDEDFINFGRGDPPPHTLPEDRLRAEGLVQDTWQLEVIPDPDSNAQVERPMTRAAGTALDWPGLMTMAKDKAVRFMSVMSCTNGGAPCGMGLWEGVPLRDVIWMARPTGNVRRAFYYGFHNHDPKQRFQGSLPIGRVLEDPPGEHPVILCYKLNNQWLSSKRGGPVRMIVPEAYGNRSVKWLQRIILTNNPQANDTYATWNNDTVSRIKTCAHFIHVPKEIKSAQPVPITGVAQVGMSGLSRVQYWLCESGKTPAQNDPYFTQAPWQDAEILPPPKDWGGGLPDGKLPPVPGQFDHTSGKPQQWPLPNSIVHWAGLIQAAQPGKYDLRCRTIDRNGVAQPMPRPFPKSGNNRIKRKKVVAV